MMDVVQLSGTSFALPSQSHLLGERGGLDDERRRIAEDQVAAWRASNELCLPDFPPDRVRALDDTLAYPPAGSALRTDVDRRMGA